MGADAKPLDALKQAERIQALKEALREIKTEVMVLRRSHMSNAVACQANRIEEIAARALLATEDEGTDGADD